MEMLVYFVIALVVAFAVMPKPPGAAAPSLITDEDVPTAEPGRPIGVVFGQYLIKSENIVWYGDLGYVGIYA